jgi:predicted NBD/HSP70 family sugar kinase
MVTLGIDIGGAKIALVLLKGARPILYRSFPTPVQKDAFCEALIRFSTPLVIRHQIHSVGIGSLGIIDRKKIKVTNCTRLPFLTEINFSKLLKPMGIKKIALDNDAACFARAELYKGQAKHKQHGLFLTLGSGLGMSFVFNGQLYNGHRNSAGEGWHPFVDKTPRFFAKYLAAAQKKSLATLYPLIADGIAALVDLLDPEIIVLGGTVAKEQQRTLIPVLENSLQLKCINRQSCPPIYVTRLREPIALGAALMAESK